jgi:hypothetical protein
MTYVSKVQPVGWWCCVCKMHIPTRTSQGKWLGGTHITLRQCECMDNEMDKKEVRGIQKANWKRTFVQLDFWGDLL